MSASDPTIPTIHYNGSSPGALMEAACDALAALLRAAQAVQAMTPNARDYYVGPAGAYEAARAEHRSRAEAIARVRAEVGAIAEGIQDQIDARARQREGR